MSARIRNGIAATILLATTLAPAAHAERGSGSLRRICTQARQSA